MVYTYTWDYQFAGADTRAESEEFIVSGRSFSLIVIHECQFYLTIRYNGDSFADVHTEITVTGYGPLFYSFNRVDNHVTVQIPDPASRVTCEFLVNNDYDSHTSTGHVGLRNLGATCYMNATLQILFNLNKFRYSLYRLRPVGRTFQLQQLFMKMESISCAVDTRSFLMRSRIIPNFHEHQDADEFIRHYFDILEKEHDKWFKKHKRTAMEMFHGTLTHYIRCEKGCVSKNKERIMGLQLNVEHGNVENALKEYLKAEKMDPKDGYKCEKHGPVFAEKGVSIKKTPRVLFILLKRFGMDYETFSSEKINSRFEYTSEITIHKKKYLLFGVVNHAGSVSDGHYYCYANTNGWLKFNDSVVNKCYNEPMDQFGGTDVYDKTVKHYSAYMLVYIRKDKFELYTTMPVTLGSHLLNKRNSLSFSKPVAVKILADPCGKAYETMTPACDDTFYACEIKRPKKYCYFYKLTVSGYRPVLADSVVSRGKYFVYDTNIEKLSDQIFLIFKDETKHRTIDYFFMKGNDSILTNSLKDRIGNFTLFYREFYSKGKWHVEKIDPTKSLLENNLKDGSFVIPCSTNMDNYATKYYLDVDGTKHYCFLRNNHNMEDELALEFGTTHFEIDNVLEETDVQSTDSIETDKQVPLIRVRMLNPRNLIFCVNACYEFDVNKIQDVRLIALNNCRVSTLCKKMRVKGGRVFESVKDSFTLREFAHDSMFSFEGLVFIKGPKKGNEVRVVYVRDTSVAGYPFIIPVRGNTLSDLRVEYGMLNKVLLWDGLQLNQVKDSVFISEFKFCDVLAILLE